MKREEERKPRLEKKKREKEKHTSSVVFEAFLFQPSLDFLVARELFTDLHEAHGPFEPAVARGCTARLRGLASWQGFRGIRIRNEMSRWLPKVVAASTTGAIDSIRGEGARRETEAWRVAKL